MAAHGDDVIMNLFLNARQQLLCFVSTVEGGKEERAAQRTRAAIDARRDCGAQAMIRLLSLIRPGRYCSRAPVF